MELERVCYEGGLERKVGIKELGLGKLLGAYSWPGSFNWRKSVASRSESRNQQSAESFSCAWLFWPGFISSNSKFQDSGGGKKESRHLPSNSEVSSLSLIKWLQK